MPRIRNTQNLTASTCDAAIYEGTGKSKTIVWDSKVPGLGLRIYPSGRKSWVIEYVTESQSRRLYTLKGQYPSVQISDARKAARDYLGQVARGTDLVAKREQAKAVAAATITVKDLVSLYNERYLPNLKTRREVYKILERDVIRAFGRRQPESLTGQEVTAWHVEIGQSRGPSAASRAFTCMRSMLGWGQEQGHVDGGWKLPKIARGKRYTYTDREVFIPEDKIPEVFPAIERQQSSSTEILKLILLTGARPSEIRTARREWVDLERGQLVIPAEHHKTGKKTRKSRRIPLCDAAVEIIRALPRHISSPFLFPGQKDPKKPINHQSVARTWSLARAEIGLDHVTVYDLRRTAATMMLAHGVDQLTIAKVLGHVGLGQVQTYARILARKEADAIDVLGSIMTSSTSS